MSGSESSVKSANPASILAAAPETKGLTQFLRLASWAPPLVGCAFVVVLLLRWTSITTGLMWDADAAAAPLIAEQFGRSGTGVITMVHFGWYSMLWLMAATRDLSGHRELWQVLPYALVIAALSALALAVRHVRGAWAGAIFLAASVAVGPLALRALVTPNYHTTTLINVALLGAALPLLSAGSAGYARRAAVALPIALLTGLNVASDHSSGSSASSRSSWRSFMAQFDSRT
jgi:isoprenylcysteine carboxyl methyltransferase (ICMT) family protein YpbQ